MASVDEILSIVAGVLFLALLGLFTIRFVKSHWAPYAYLMFFCLLRVVGYGLRAYVDTLNQVDNTNWVPYYIADTVLLSIGVIFILLLLAKLYHSILPKLRAETGEERGRFERTLVDRTRLFLLPIVICVVIGASYASPTNSISQQNTGLVLRKVGVCLLAIFGVVYLISALTYRKRYPANQRAFTIALVVTILFDISLVYKIVYTFDAVAATKTAAYFILGPFLELIALGVLSVDLQSHFLGYKYTPETELVKP
ncbi:hypothetical protein EMPS_05186 [Entomortierella parvispora]|uniref:DUF7702 domain-containing protein n=1 Tax=Entomortierella parvispora TaxID=205924 RepID=A0A9P3HAJ8_9FUNG|nr:hypothetical protein EMPS_05186 [Entomortierella parvispora]